MVMYVCIRTDSDVLKMRVKKKTHSANVYRPWEMSFAPHLFQPIFSLSLSHFHVDPTSHHLPLIGSHLLSPQPDPSHHGCLHVPACDLEQYHVPSSSGALLPTLGWRRSWRPLLTVHVLVAAEQCQQAQRWTGWVQAPARGAGTGAQAAVRGGGHGGRRSCTRPLWLPLRASMAHAVPKPTGTKRATEPTCSRSKLELCGRRVHGSSCASPRPFLSSQRTMMAVPASSVRRHYWTLVSSFLPHNQSRGELPRTRAPLFACSLISRSTVFFFYTKLVDTTFSHDL